MAVTLPSSLAEGCADIVVLALEAWNAYVSAKNSETSTEQANAALFADFTRKFQLAQIEAENNPTPQNIAVINALAGT